MRVSLSTADPPCNEDYTLSLHDALPISSSRSGCRASASMNASTARSARPSATYATASDRWIVTIWLPGSEEHTSELQSQFHLVCRLLLEKKNTFYGYSRPRTEFGVAQSA